MFKATNYRIVLALSISFVMSAEAQQRDTPQKACLTPRDAFEVNEPGAKLCPPTQSKPATSGTATGKSSATPASPNAGGTTQTTTETPKKDEPIQQIEPIRPPERSNQNVSQVTAGSLPPLVLKYDFLKKSGTRNWVAADLATEFRTGDQIKLNVEASERAYFYILAKGASGQWNIPGENINGERLLPRHETYEVPVDIIFSDPPGQERLIIILSRKPIQDLQRLRDSRENAGPAKIASNIEDSTVEGIRLKARDLVFEVSSSESYVANGDGSADALLWVDIILNHK